MSFKSKFSCAAGCSLEWIDFSLYGFFGPIFSKLFFSHSMNSAWLSLLIVYAIFAIGFLARPLGAIIFGYIGDRYGRSVTLKTTPIFLSLSTAMIALLPTYQSVGIVSVFILLALRVVQGIFLGGEFSNSIVYLCESSHKNRYFMGSFASLSGSFGIFSASLITSAFYHFSSQGFLYLYGWRIAFLISLPIGLVIFFLRRQLKESSEFELGFKNPIKSGFKEHKLKILLALGLIYLHATSFYFVYMFLPIFLVKIRKVTEASAFFNNSWFLVFHLLMIPIFGKLVNQLGGFKSNLISCCLFLLLIPVCSFLISQGSMELVFTSIALLSLMTALNAAVIPGLLCEVIPAKVRCTILGIAFNLGFGIIGGIVPLLCLFLVKTSGNLFLPSAYLEISTLITLITTFYFVSIRRKPYETRSV